MFSNLNNLGVPLQASNLGLPSQAGQAAGLSGSSSGIGQNAAGFGQAPQADTFQSNFSGLLDTMFMMFQGNPFSNEGGIQKAPESARKSTASTAQSASAEEENPLASLLPKPQPQPQTFQRQQPIIAGDDFQFKPLMNIMA